MKKFEIRKSKFETDPCDVSTLVLSFGYSDFEIVSNLEFRI
jgi:hypothetical protein